MYIDIQIRAVVAFARIGQFTRIAHSIATGGQGFGLWGRT